MSVKLQRTWRGRVGRAVIWSLAIVLILFASYRFAGTFVENKLRAQLSELAARSCATIDASTPPTVQVDLLDGHVLIAGVSFLESGPCSGAYAQLTGRLDSLEVTGLSVANILFRHKFSVHKLRIRSSMLRVKLLATEDTVEAKATATVTGEPWLVDVGSFTCESNAFTMITAEGDSIVTSGQGLLMSGTNVRVLPATKGGRSAEALKLSLGGISGTFVDGTAWSIGRCSLDQATGTFALYQASIGPRAGLEQHSTTLPFEKDVIQARIDTVQFAGLDLGKAFTSGVWTVRKVLLSSGEVTVLRDKTLVDGPSAKQLLPGALMRRLPLGWGADTIVAERMNVRYRERADRERGYADIPFGQMGATITGLRNVANDTNAYVVQAHCIAFGAAPVSMVLRGLAQDTTDRFDLDATIGAMAFAELNVATGPLLDIRLTEGRIHSVAFHMSATDKHASGSVLMHYDGLKLSSGGRRRKETMNRLETILLNTLVQDDHRDSKGAPREGRFSFPRRQDRAVFNYMWSGLREGTKAVLLPEMLTR